MGSFNRLALPVLLLSLIMLCGCGELVPNEVGMTAMPVFLVRSFRH